MSSELHRAAYSVLLPAFGDLQLDDTVRRYLNRGGVSLLLGETRDEYVGRDMSPQRKASESRADFIQVVQEATALAGAPLLIAVDQELGGIERLHQLVPAVASRAQLQGLSAQDIEQRCFEMATAARGLGVNLFLAPIVDVVTGVNPWLLNRHLGTDPVEVSRVSCAFIRGVQRAGVVATAKHFPGHYVTEQDPAIAEATVPGPLELLHDNLEVFKTVIATGVKAVMPGPAVFPAIDPDHSASTSPKVIGVLRDTLGFEGLIISDDLDAVSILRGNSITDTAVASLLAGAHLLLVSSESGLDAIADAIVAAVHDGVLDQQWLLDAASRVRQLAIATQGTDHEYL
ncbi:glycoside hydrolase family 3 N-terminal domain-containing protein [Pseudomonas gingeri]|uniref:glycoside hydrolase family 3 N-terminal domain-containing protein n=1 Tax=Pseudomonas gingeri TaxID=117681 RepID=UPI0015A2A9CB|nr:glycoside hydrolase family 3 N-terminal domain-containing protein [Pseudomonas gingeri]NWD06876.1 glycoside hydrolase family 3 protein [Pseudomonas gingeri]NWD48300.1 glycoside hydrolase family 3 protein [Pseudomonas gingeri]NWE26506.1 glycoside hydrolase family 3 protein [Pseudomonas gingeri]NWE31474.1 glycoside hydrolase family 3 protein [Pseudomonas gingeri]NWE57508.1 glycoside hydrolase family 3 protein [Pseudomonas gingeri]